MEPLRIKIIVQLILNMFYLDEDFGVPLLLFGANTNPRQEIEIAKNVMKSGISVQVVHGSNNNLTSSIDGDFKLNIFVDFDRLRDDQIFQDLAERKLFSTKRSYLIIGSDFIKFQSAIQSVPIFLNAAIKFVELPSDNFEQIKVFDVKNLAQPFGGIFEYPLQMVFEWSNGMLVKKIIEVKAEADSGWSKITLPIGLVCHLCKNSTMVSEELMNWYTSDKDLTKDATPRLGYFLFEAVRDAVGFKSTIICREIWSVNSLSGGALGDLTSGKTVLSASPLIGLENRVPILDMLFSVFKFRSTFTFQTPPLDDLSGSAFLSPFSLTLWICILCSVLIIGVIMRQVIFLEVRESTLIRNQPFIPSLPLTMLSSFGALCQQGMSLVLKWNSSRILQVTFFFSSFVLFNYYTSLVVSSLISFPKPTKITTMQALIDSNLDLGADNSSYFYYFVQESKLKHVRDLNKKLNNKKKYVYTPEEGVALARVPGFAYHCEKAVTLKEMQKTYNLFEMCNYHDVTFIKVHLLICVGHHFQMGEFFKKQYMKAVEVGLASKADSLFGEPKTTCLSNAIIEEVDLKYVGPVLLFLIYAMAVSLLILIVEILYVRVSSRYE